MADRSVRVTLSAQVQGYIAAMEKAAQATRETGSEAEKLGAQKQAFEDIGRAAMVAGGLTAAGVGLAVAKFSDFDQAMSNVQAATHESAENMQRLSDAALEAGARTVFSAEESANAIEELAKAGVSTADIISGGLDGALDLAAAGGLGVADAAGIAATALKTFNLEGSDMAHVADLLAAGAGKAMGDVTDLSQALNQSAMVANATGLSIEETTAGLAAFASQGLLGSDAGTSFKSMLQSLTPTSEKAATTMQELGISAYDSQGNFVGLAEFAGNLQMALKDLSVEQQQAALKTIFGSDAIRAATVLYSEGEEGIRDWISAVDDQGYAAETARARLDNLKGDLEALGGALDTALIKTGEHANDALRELVQGITGMIDAYTNLPPELQSAALATGVFVAAVGLVGGGILVAVPKIAEFRASLQTLGITAESTSASLAKVAPAGIAIAAVPIAANMVDWIRSFRDTTTAAAELERELKKTGDITQELTQGLAGGNPLANLGIGTDQIALNHLRELNTVVGDLHATFENTTLGKALTLSMGGLSTGAGEAKQQIEDLDTALAGLVSAGRADEAAAGFEQFAKMAKEAGWSQDDINAKLPKYAAAQEDAALASQEASEAAAANSDALAELSESAVSTEEAVEDLADTIRNFGKAQFDVEAATIAFNEAFQGLQGILNEGTGSLDVTTEAGQNTGKALLEAAKSTNEYAAATMAAGGSTEEVSAILESGRQRIIDTRVALGETTEQAKAYADRLVATPEAIATQVQLMGVELAEQMLAHLTRTRETYINVIATGLDEANNALKNAFGSARGNLFAYANGGIAEFANGGITTGIYSGGAPLYKFAEPEVGWEAFISGKPSERDRNRQIWAETGNRLGMNPAGSSAPPVVYVQNPWGEGYLRAKVTEVADARIDVSIQQQAQANRRAGL